MKTKSRILLLVFALLTLTIALGGCLGDKSGGTSESVAIGIPQDLESSLDPHLAEAAGTREILFNIFEGLVKPDSSGNLNPAIAESYEILDRGKTYVFKLREGVKFHNGNTVTAQDVKYSIERCAEAGMLVAAYSNVESVTLTDDSTVEVTLKDADTEFLAYMTAAIVPENYADQAVNPIGTGPYKYVSRSPQENIILEKFDDYWGEKAHIKTVNIKIVASADMIVTNLQSGAIDFYARITSTQADQLTSGFDIVDTSMNLVQALYLNNLEEPFNDVRIRQALCYAVNKQEILDLTAGGKGTPIGSSMFPSFKQYYIDELSNAYSTDIDKAKELLSEAGYPEGFSMTITVPSNYQQHIDTAQVLVEQFKAIGVTAEIVPIEWSSWLSDVYVGRNYQSTVIGVDASSLTGRALLERFKSDASDNFINYSSAKYDEAFKNAMNSSNLDAKIGYYKECERILSEEAANVYIQDMSELVAVRDTLEGYEHYPLYVQDFAKLKYK